VVRGDAFGNAQRAAEFENHRQLAKIGKPVDRSEWITTPATVNAFYNPLMNDINFPAAILQPPFFDPKSTDAENYGHIGAVIGHELTHGFDDSGRQFDGNGNLSDWWTAEDGKKFDAMTDCEVKEYGSFTAVDDVKLNGKLTLGENTADNGGLRLAYMAFLADAKRMQAVTTRIRSSLLRLGRIGAEGTGRSSSGCRCRPIRTRRMSFESWEWCRICPSSARHSDARRASL